MLKLLKQFDTFLRNRPFRESEEVCLVKIDFDEWNERIDPWYTDVYRTIRRAYNRTVEFPSGVYCGIKYFIQRGRRGWAVCDTWSLDNYLSEWLPDALRHLKKSKHGIPGGVFEGLPTENDDGCTHTDEAYTIAEARWDDIMDKMIAGFEAWNRMQDLLYEKELGDYPYRRPKNVNKEDWKKIRDNRFKLVRELCKRDEKIFDEGITLFGKWFGALWD